jgi:hypothetical protein
LASRILLFIACTLAAALSSAAALAAGEPPAPPTPKTTYVPGRIVVVWEEDASRDEKITAKREAEVDSAVTLGDPSFQAVEVEPLLAPASIPNDPLYGKLWALKNTGAGVNGFAGAVAGADINAPTAWDSTVGAPSTVVADIDSGYRFAGTELGPVAVTGFDFVGANADSPSEDSDPTDDNLISGGHGVHTAGTIGAAGNNGNGITGVAQDARIMPLRVCAASPMNSNALRCPTTSIVSAINYAGSHGAKVANISLTSTSFSTAMLKALGGNPGTLFVISAGNDEVDNESEPHYPCNYKPQTSGVAGAIDNVVCVAATDQADELAGFSDWGASSVDLAAPGTEILSTYTVDNLLGIEGENFESEAEGKDFGSRWTPGGEGGFGRTSEAPLSSFGMSDSPEEATPVANSTRESELTTALIVPAGYSSCQFSGRRFVSLGPGASFTQEILKEGSATPIFKSEPGSTSGSVMVPFETVAISAAPGSNVKIRFRFKAGTAPEEGNGVWLDDLSFKCKQPTSAAPAYAFLQGTSMAAPQVSGTAALLFSFKPAASVTAVRNALLAGVDQVPSLAGKSVTGGRLDAAKALAELDTTPPAEPTLSSTDPPSPDEENNPRILGSAEPGSTVKIYEGGFCAGSPVAQGSAAQLASPGITVSVPSNARREFSATATDASLNASPCSTPILYTTIIDEIPPVAPVLETNPPSPAANGAPRILGEAEAGSLVDVYANGTCTAPVLKRVNAETLASTGVSATVPASTTMSFSARAEDAAQNKSPCSIAISYTNSSAIPTPPVVVMPPGETQPEPPVTTPSCTVPKLTGKTLAQAKAAIVRAACRVGKVTKPKTQPGQKTLPLVVKSSTPGAGAKPASGVVALRLGPKPKARHTRSR